MPNDTADTTLICFKGFDKDWKSHGFQFEAGKTYEHKSQVELCFSGFHAVEAPFDVFNYYSRRDGSNYALVELAGVTNEKGADTKRVGSKLTIKTALTIPALIKAQVEFVLCRAKGKLATDKCSHAAATGYRSHAAATGNCSHAAATGDCSHAAATGDCSHAAATGNRGHAAATGNRGHAAATGYYGRAAAMGYDGHAAAMGDYGHAAATGDWGHAAATGNWGHATATGYGGHAAAMGDRGHAAAMGDDGHAETKNGVAIARERAKAGENGALVILWWDDKRERYIPVVGLVGENDIQANTWYSVDDKGQLVKVSP